MEKNVATALFLFILLCHMPEKAEGQALLIPSDSTNAMAADSLPHRIQGSITLNEVEVEGNSRKTGLMRSSLNAINIGKQYIEEHFSNSLMQSLAKQPGVKAMAIGSGASKPIIRGLGFNRVVVAENGIKHEGQQWGDDHGLEIDQYAIDRAEVIKGPAAIAYGSDAIGGVVNLQSNAAPRKRMEGGMNLFTHSNNESIGAAGRIAGRKGRFWYKINATSIWYADYRIPADSIQYYSYYIKLHKRRLRNTAGHENDDSVALGYEGERWNTSLRVSCVNTRSGFFANAHGLEVRMSDIDYDHSRRDIDLPYHQVNHLFVSNHSEWRWKGGKAEGNVGWQNNRQKEFSEPVSHGYMPTPHNTLERSFNKNTLSANMHALQMIESNTVHAGAHVEYQDNRRGGWGFVLPDFQSLQFGAYVSDRFIIDEDLIVNAGIRYDHGGIDIKSYKDWYKTPVSDGDSSYIERSANIHKLYNSLTWSVGINRRIHDFMLKANIGKSFRMPIAKELGTDGINYNIFRYEKGNADLKPEESYQMDAGITYNHKMISAWVAPYVNYFPNYIYLNPTSEYTEGLQLYYYTQSRVLRWGLEASFTCQLHRSLEMNIKGEYLYARQLSGEKKGYSLPFSTPWSVSTELRYTLPADEPSKGGFAAIECEIVGSQNEVVPPEEPTPGYQLLNASMGKNFHVGRNDLRLVLRCDNLLGKKYYNHTSYYRLIGVPEPGRNFSMMAAWNF